MYASMTHGSSMRDLCQRLNPQNLRINERRLVQFGLIEGLIRRVYKVIRSIVKDPFHLNNHLSYLLSTFVICSIQYICRDPLLMKRRKTIQFISTLQEHTVLMKFVVVQVNQLHKSKILLNAIQMLLCYGSNI